MLSKQFYIIGFDTTINEDFEADARSKHPSLLDNFRRTTAYVSSLTKIYAISGCTGTYVEITDDYTRINGVNDDSKTECLVHRFLYWLEEDLPSDFMSGNVFLQLPDGQDQVSFCGVNILNFFNILYVDSAINSKHINPALAGASIARRVLDLTDVISPLFDADYSSEQALRYLGILSKKSDYELGNDGKTDLCLTAHALMRFNVIAKPYKELVSKALQKVSL